MKGLSVIEKTEELPWYRPIDRELELFELCYKQGLPLMLKGPTGCGKSRFVEYLACRLKWAGR